MKLDDPQCVVSSTLGLGEWVISWIERSWSSTTYHPFFFPILLVPFLCIIHASPNGRFVAIVVLRSGTWTLDTTNDVNLPRVEVLLIIV